MQLLLSELQPLSAWRRRLRDWRLRSRHECGLLSRQIRREILMELRGIKVSETVCRLLYRTRLAEITRKALSVVSLILASVRHMGCNVDQSNNQRIRPGFSNHRPP